MKTEINTINGVKIPYDEFEYIEEIISSMEKRFKFEIVSKEFTEKLKEAFSVAWQNDEYDSMLLYNMPSFRENIKNLSYTFDPLFEGKIYFNELNTVIMEYLKENVKTVDEYFVIWRGKIWKLNF